MKRLIRHVSGQGPKLIKEIPGKIIVVTQSLASVRHYQEEGFTFVTQSDLATDRLNIMTNLKFRVGKETADATIVALSVNMLHSLSTKFSHRFRKSSPNRMVLAQGLQPEKTWAVFRNLGIHHEAFGSQERWLNDFTVYTMHPRGWPIIHGPKNVDRLKEIVERFTV